jgi:hypothetical protein
MQKLLKTLGLSLLLLTFAVAAFGQVTKGSISGTVADASGAVVGDARVKATGSETGVVLTTTSDKAGIFHFNLIQPGLYKVEIAKQGFATTVLDKVDVGTGSDSGLGTIKLSVGGSAIIVEVQDESALLETTQSQTSTTLTSATLQALPGLNENEGLDSAALLVPGVVASRDNGFSNTNGGTGFSVNGLRGRSNDQQIDGQNNNDNSVGGPALPVTTSEFVAEYKVVTDNFSAEYARNSGSVIDVVTKSGSNNLHGSLYGAENANWLNTLENTEKNPIWGEGLTKLPRSNDEQGGFTLGGPVRKDKVFFFEGLTEEILHEDNNSQTSNLTPTSTGIAQLLADYPNSTSLLALKNYGPFAVTFDNPQPVNAAPLTIAGKPYEFSGVFRSTPEREHKFDWLNKVDVVGNKDTLNFRYMLQRNNWFNIPYDASGAYYNEPSLAQQTKAGWTRAISNKAVNEFAVSYGRTNVSFGGGSGSIPALSAVDQGLAHVSIGSNNLAFGPPTTYPQGRIVNTWQLQDNFSYQLGKHQLKAGINWTYQRSPNVFLPNLNGSFTYSKSSQAASWLAFLNNTPTSISIAKGNPKLDFREYDTFWYVGDDWKVKSNLTLNLGLSYTFYGQPSNLFNKNDTAIANSSTPFWDPSLASSIRIFQTPPTQTTLFSPRVGFAWTPKFIGDGKTVLRGGYSLSYDPPYYNIYLNMASSAPQVFSTTLSGTTANAIPMLAAPFGPAVRTQLGSYLSYGTADPREYSQTQISKDFGAQKVQSWSFGLQREISSSVVAEVRYVGNHGGKLFQSVNANPYIADLAADYPNLIPAGVTVAANGRVDGNYGLVRKRTNTGYSDYNGLQTQLRANRLWSQLTLTTSYTYSKTTDNVSEIYGSGGGGNTTAFAQNPLDYKGGEHSVSGLDVPNNWTVSFVEELPFFKSQKGLTGKALGGWSLAGTYFIASGQPYTPLQYYIATGSTGNYWDSSFNAAFAGTYDNLRPFKGNASAPATSVGIYGADAAAIYGYTGFAKDAIVVFSDVNTGAASPATTTKDKVRYIVNGPYAESVYGTPFGNVSRNAARDAWSNTGNVTINKSVKIKEGMTAAFHASMLNVFNHPNYSSVDPYLDDAGYTGVGTGFADPSYTTGGRRTIWLGAKIGW